MYCITQMRSTCEMNAFTWRLTRVDPCSNMWRSLFELVLVLIRTCEGCCSNACRLSFECGKIFVRTCFAFLSNACKCWANAFSFSSEHVCLIIKRSWFLDGKRLAVVRKRLASPPNAFGFSFERVWLLVRTRLTSRLNASRHWFELVHMRSKRVRTWVR